MRAGLLEIGGLVRRWRREAGMTQRHVEAVSGVDQTIISRLECGRLESLRLTRLAAVIGAVRPPPREWP